MPFLPSPVNSALGDSPQESLSLEADSDTHAFLLAFNSKYDVTANCLFDVIDLIDSLLAKKSSRAINTQQQWDNAKLQELKSANAKLQFEKDNLAAELTATKAQLDRVQHSFTAMRNEQLGASENHTSMHNENENLRRALDSMNQLTEMQITDLAALSEQRTRLLTLTSRQDQAMAEFEKLCRAAQHSRAAKKTIDIPAPKPTAEPNDELYTLMCSLIILAEETVPQMTAGLIAIRDESQTPLRERILLIVRSLATQIGRTQGDLRDMAKKNEVLNESIQKTQNRCCDLLSLFEEELQFLQTLTHSTDLQAAIFGHRGSCTFGEDEKLELIRHCAMMGRFVEETIGTVTPERFDELFHAPSGSRATHVFELFQPTTLEDKLGSLLSHIASAEETLEMRELFDLLSAQVFVNELMKNHANELHLRIAHYGNEITGLRRELQNHTTHSEDVKQAVRGFKRREAKLKRFLGRHFELTEESDPDNLIKALVESTRQEVPHPTPQKVGLISPKNPTIATLRQQLEDQQQTIEELRKARQTEVEEETKNLERQLSEIKARFQQTVQEHESQTQEVLALRITIREKDLEFSAKLEQVQTELTEAREKLSASALHEETQATQIKEFETAVVNVKKQRQKLGQQIERLQATNTKLQEALAAQGTQLREQVRQLSEQSEKLAQERDACLSQSQLLTAKNEQLSSEIATLTVANKSLDVKVRAHEERASLERRNLQSQAAAQAAAAQVEQATQLASLQAQIEDAVRDLSALVADDFSGADLKTVVSAVEAAFENAKRAQALFLELQEDVSESQKLLGIAASAKISREVAPLIERRAAVERQMAELERKAKQDKQDAEQARREAKRAEQQILGLKLWESWGQRVHRVIHDTEAVDVTGRDLRVILEEALLASVAHRAVSARLESLRTQKMLLLKFDGKLLTAKMPVRGGLRPIIAICIFVRRMQKFSGHLSVGIGFECVEAVPRGRVADDTPKKRRRSRSVKRTCRSPLRTLFP
jgi:hypothetical protein